MRINKETLTSLWYETEDGRRHYPTKEDLAQAADPPLGFDYMRSQFPCTLVDDIFRLVKEDGRIVRSEKIAQGSSGWPADLVLAMANSGDYDLGQSILLAARSCERCMNVLGAQYGLKWGYTEDSEDYKSAGTSCEFCVNQ